MTNRSRKPTARRSVPKVANYKVGHKKPPPESRFKKGISGNPSGRPKRSSSLDDFIMKELHRPVPATLNGESVCQKNIVFFAQKLVKAGITKGPSSMKLLLDCVVRLEARTAAKSTKPTEEELWPKQTFSWDEEREKLYQEMMAEDGQTDGEDTGEEHRGNDGGDDNRRE